MVEASDVKDLLEVYRDKHALPYFNSDNCHGDIFFYETEERLKQGIEYFIRNMEDGTQKGLLRLDLRSDYETKECIYEILENIIPTIEQKFESKETITKAAPYAVERVATLQMNGYVPYDKPIIGWDETMYRHYWIRIRE